MPNSDFRVCAKCNSEMSIFADFAKMPKCQKIGIGVAKTPKSDKNPVFRQKNDQKTRQKHDITRAKTSILYVRCGRNYRKIHCLEVAPPPLFRRFSLSRHNPKTAKPQPVSDAPRFLRNRDASHRKPKFTILSGFNPDINRCTIRLLQMLLLLYIKVYILMILLIY